MAVARPWLPDGAMTSPQAVSAIGATIGAWVRHWFHAPALHAAPRWTRWSASAEEGGDGWSPPQTLLPHMSLQYRIDIRDIVGGALITHSGSRDLRHANDRQLLRSAADSVLADLDDRLKPLVSALHILAPNSKADRAGSLYCLSIEDDAGRGVIRVFADAAVVVALVKQHIKGLKGDVALIRRAEAIADARVACAALLGRATLPYRDVRGLAVGDVVILQSGRDTGCDLLVEGKVAAHGAVRIPAAGNNPLSPQ